MKFDLMVCDYDGTIAEKGTTKIDSEVVESIKRFIKNGGKFAICSGRPYASVKKIMDDHGIEGYIMAEQGAVIGYSKNDEIIVSNGFEIEDCVQLIKKFLEEDQTVVAYAAREYYYQTHSPMIEFFEKRLGVKGVKVDNLIEFIQTRKIKIARVALLSKEECINYYVDKYNSIYNFNKIIFNSGSKNMVESISSNYHKGFAVKFLAEYLNIPFEKIIAVGDSTNDIPLLKGEWHGVAVGDGRDELKAVADEVTVPFKDKPVKTLLEKYCLND